MNSTRMVGSLVCFSRFFLEIVGVVEWPMYYFSISLKDCFATSSHERKEAKRVRLETI